MFSAQLRVMLLRAYRSYPEWITKIWKTDTWLGYLWVHWMELLIVLIFMDFCANSFLVKSIVFLGWIGRTCLPSTFSRSAQQPSYEHRTTLQSFRLHHSWIVLYSFAYLPIRSCFQTADLAVAKLQSLAMPQPSPSALTCPGLPALGRQVNGISFDLRVMLPVLLKL